jgi:creatinine amidohydrolase
MMHGFIPPERFLPYLSWTEIEALPDRANTVILQPLGAIEQHGPHLPVVTDMAIASGVLGAALARLDASVPAYSLAPLGYGKSDEHVGFPGTITLSAETLLHLLMEIGHSVYRSGFRKLAFVNAHGGQPQVVEIAARQLRIAYSDLEVFPLFIWNVPRERVPLPPGVDLETEIHAGDSETSLMLALLPEQVRMALARREVVSLKPGSLLSIEGKLPFAWVTRDLSGSGVIGDPTHATREKGEALLDALAQGWVRVLTELHTFRQPSTNTRASG